MRRLALLLAALAAPALAQAPDLDGLFVGVDGGGLAVFNPEPDAPFVHVTPAFASSLGSRADTLNGAERRTGTGGSRQTSFSPSLSPAGRMAFVADWLRDDDGTYGFRIYAIDRDGTDPVVLTPVFSSATSWEQRTPRPDISPDGQTVTYTVVTSGLRATGTLWTVPSDGSAAPSQIALPPATNVEGTCDQTALAAVFSPDGADILYLGVEPALWDDGDDGVLACQPALRLIRPDGTNDRLLHALYPLDGSGASSPNGQYQYRDARIALDWEGDVLVFSGPTYFDRFDGRNETFDASLRFARASTGEAFAETETPETPTGLSFKPRSVRLSPDGTYLGFIRDRSDGYNDNYIAVRPLDPAGSEYLYTSYPKQGYYGFDWVDAPALPEPASFALEATSELVWARRAIDLAPTLRAADGTVLSRTARHYEYGSQTFTAVNHFTGELWGRPDSGTRNRLEQEHCAENAGLRACRTIDLVNTPLLGFTVVDDDIAEAGRNPGLFRIYRYGRPDVEAIPVWEARRNGSGVNDAFHYLDYTLSVLPERIRWPASDALADTLQTLDVVLTPIDDGLEEPEIERGQLRLACYGATGSIFGPDEENCQTAVQGDIPGVTGIIGTGRQVTSYIFSIASNGAGSGLALATSTPDAIPASGQATLTINGQGMAEGATVTLSGPGSFSAEHVAVLRGGVQARARFALDGAPAGTYDLTVTSGGETATLANAVTVDASTPGGTTDVWATLQSRSGRQQLPLTQYIVYGNDGTADAALTPLLIAIPPGFEAEFADPLYEFPDPPEGYDPDASPWRTQKIAAVDVPGLCFRPARQGADGRVSCPSRFNAGGDSLEYSVAVMFLPTIAPGSQGRLGVDVTKTGNSTLPWFVKVGAPFNTLEFEDDDVSRVAGEMWAGGSRPVSPTNLAGCGADAQARLALEFDEAAAASCASCLGAVLNFLVSGSSYGRCAKAAIGAAQSLYQTSIDIAAGSDGYTQAANGTSTLVNVTRATLECLGAANPVTGVIGTLYTSLTNLSSLTACATCFSTISWGVIGEVYSRDPNDKLGPVGVHDDGYVAEFGRMGYTVRFENLETATASAVEVTVTDTLNTAVYDLSTFELGPVSLRDTTFTPPPGLQTWTTFWDRRPAVPSIVRVHGALDAETGVATWLLSDLDPSDYSLRTSAEAGFLPPNDADGAGEGWVRFTVRALPDLPDGTVVANGATIRFDRNELIETPVWANTLDLGAPTSRALSAERFDADSSWVVRFEGADDGAGVAGYDLYAQADGGPFVFAGTVRADSAVFRGDPGVAYGFFALATDWVGNDEALKTQAEVITGGVSTADPTDGPDALELAAPYPNPTRGAAVLQVGVPAAGRVRVAVYDVSGREVAVVLDAERVAGWHRVPWDGSALAAGVYVVRAEAGGRAVIRALTVVR